MTNCETFAEYIGYYSEENYFDGQDRELWLYQLEYSETQPPVVILTIDSDVEVDDVYMFVTANADIMLYRRCVIYQPSYDALYVVREDILLLGGVSTRISILDAEKFASTGFYMPVYPMKPMKSLTSGGVEVLSSSPTTANNKGQSLFNSSNKIFTGSSVVVEGAIVRDDPCLPDYHEINRLTRFYFEIRKAAHDEDGEGFACQIFTGQFLSMENDTDMGFDLFTLTISPLCTSVPYEILGTRNGKTKVTSYILDIPLLRDTDLDNGVYHVLDYPVDVYPTLYVFNGLEYIPRIQPSNGIRIGKVTDKLKDADPNVFYRDSITVTFADEIAPITQSQFLAEHYLAFVGRHIGSRLDGELISFRDIIKTAPAQYKLSFMKRGLRGTEHFVNSHVKDEIFILLKPNTFDRIDLDNSLNNTIVNFKTGLGGQDLLTVPLNPLDYQAYSQKPWSPLPYLVRQYSTGDLIIKWFRRPRANNQLTDGVNTPLIESSENYQLQIVGGRTVSTTTAMYVYSASSQIMDFGVLQSALDINLYQIGDNANGFVTNLRLELYRFEP